MATHWFMRVIASICVMDSEMSLLVQPAAPALAAASRSSAVFMHLPPPLIVSSRFSPEQDFVDPRRSQRHEARLARLVDDDEVDVLAAALLVDGDPRQRPRRQAGVEVG